MRNFFTSAICLLCCLPVASQELVMQLPIGQPLDRDLPKCTLSAKPNLDYCNTDKHIKKTGLKNAELDLFAPSYGTQRQLPAWVAIELAKVKIDKLGNISSMRFRTKGGSVIKDTYESITTRFGKPVFIDANNNQLVIWETPALHITHSCAGPDFCLVQFTTTEEEAKQKAQRDKIPRPPATP